MQLIQKLRDDKKCMKKVEPSRQWPQKTSSALEALWKLLFLIIMYLLEKYLHEFEHLEIWELVPHPDQVMIFTLKWIYKVKLDELGGVLKNKANQGAKGKLSG
ncbi:hypothetical protein Tco_0753289 [Tanacetum coccineum]